MNSSRIVHITDCHLLPEDGAKYYDVDTYQSLTWVCDAISNHDKSVDALVVTGDHAEDGSIATYRRSIDVLKRVNAPIFTLPGNHDNLPNMRESFADSDINVLGTADIGSWKFIALNSQVVDQSHGYVSAESIDYILDEATKADGRPVALALHHSPMPECASSGCAIANNEEFLTTLSEHSNIRLVLSGHVHKSVHHRFAHIDLLTTPSTFAQVWHAQAGESEDHDDFWLSHKIDISRHGYRIIDIFDDGSINTEVCWVDNAEQ